MLDHRKDTNKSTKRKMTPRGRGMLLKRSPIRAPYVSYCVVLVVTMTMLLTAFYVNSPTPNGIKNPWKYRCFLAGKRVVADMAKVLSLLTSTSYVNNFRFLMDIFVRPTPLEMPGSNIRASVTTFGGVKVRLYQPIRREPGRGPALVYAHGGAFAIGSAASFDPVTRRIAEALNCTVVSVDYRLAPEHPFPAAFEDILNASKWFMDHAHDFGVDRSRIGIAGDSAGGTLAAVVSQELHDDPAYPDFAFQAPIYPLTQLIDSLTPGTLHSKHHFGRDGSIVTWDEAAMFCSLYLTGGEHARLQLALIRNVHVAMEFRRSDAPQLKYVNHSLLPPRLRSYDFLTPSSSHVNHGHLSEAEGVWKEIKDKVLDPRVCPLMRHNMGGLPPTFVATCEYDAVRDHGIFYAMRLREAGVRVRWEHYDGGFHGVLGPSWPFEFEVGEQMFHDFGDFATEHLKLKS
ncbi:arylacetamide deacetylase-like [Patiria miniata]|uniref:Alpha/beta hydrolase fold-3 domain-containing protein n=1 Tax=Patiria miniata TaxID=46514 RepID=A0A913ZHG1_PATMI|nr:arylacetamide deacetylase-like [Patiria miniata]